MMLSSIWMPDIKMIWSCSRAFISNCRTCSIAVVKQ
jgi:hypothetical protein